MGGTDKIYFSPGHKNSTREARKRPASLRGEGVGVEVGEYVSGSACAGADASEGWNRVQAQVQVLGIDFLGRNNLGFCWKGVGGAICFTAIKDDDDDNNGDNDDEDGGGYDDDDDDDDDEDDESAFVCARA